MYIKTRDNRLNRLSDGLTDHCSNINALVLIQILLKANRMIQRMKKAPDQKGEYACINSALHMLLDLIWNSVCTDSVMFNLFKNKIEIP